MEKQRVREFDLVQFSKMVRRIKLFASMRMDLLEKILSWVRVYRCAKGERICSEGDPGDSFFVIYEGKVAVTIKKWLFFSKRVAVLGPGDCFGEMALLRRAPRNATVTCLEPVAVFVVMAEHFDEALKGNPDFAGEMEKIVKEREFEDRVLKQGRGRGG